MKEKEEPEMMDEIVNSILGTRRVRRTLAKDETVLKSKSTPVSKEYIEYDGKTLVTEVWISKVTTKHIVIREASEYERTLHKFVSMPKFDPHADSNKE